MKVSGQVWLPLTMAAVALMAACTGRRADNMEPKGETVEVVIPEGDVVTDSAVAAGEVAPGDTVVSQSEEVAIL